jgi:hypothetical protein
MSAVEDYIHTCENINQRNILAVIHDLIRDMPGITHKLRYNIPFYYRKSWICYLNPIKKEGIELAFLRGNELSNEQGILDFKGRKQVAGIDVFEPKEIPLIAINEILQEALLLDEQVKYASKRSKEK